MFYRTQYSIGIPLVVVLVASMLAFLYYVELLDPCEWANKTLVVRVVGTKKEVEYSVASLVGIVLNLLIIFLLVIE